MPKVQYVGDADIRRIRKSDFARDGLDHDAVEWSRANRFVVEINGDDVAEFLAGHGNGEFKVLKDDAEPKQGTSGAERKTGTHQATGKRRPGTASEVSASAGTPARTDSRTGGTSA